MYQLLRPVFFQLDPERAHDLALQAAELLRKSGAAPLVASSLEAPVECLGLTFKNPVGLAAGLDKNGAYIDAMAALGFGFVEVGTITPKPQAGNDKPRLFRLTREQAIINRFGFNNVGLDGLIANLERTKYSGVLGINIGKNAVTPVDKAGDDYLICLERVYAHASYVTVNISSPNTKNLRDLQEGDALRALLDKLKNRQAQLESLHGKKVPLLVKVAPDLDSAQIEAISQTLIDTEIEGLIATNTTLDRMAVQGSRYAAEAGGLSGAPLMRKSTEVLAEFAQVLQGQIPLIGVGGINCGAGAKAKVDAGASLVQLYSGLIYKGPSLISDCVRSLKKG